jgi:DNA primase large subunit
MISSPRLGFLKPEMQLPEWAKAQYTSFGRDAAQTREDATNFLYSLVQEDVTKPDHITPESLALSLWLLKAINDTSLFSRFSVTARDIYQHMIESFNPDMVEDASMSLGIRVERVEGKIFRIKALDYIRSSTHLSGARYRLAFQDIKDGWVYLEKSVLSKILREHFVNRVKEFYEAINSAVAVQLLGDFHDLVQYIGDQWMAIKGKRTTDLGSVDQSLFPPCIKEYLVEVRDGVNLSHMERFTLVSFLHKIGMQNTEIMALFRTAPDFNQRITEYQVNHVTGQISGTEYSPPKCEVLRSNHVCYWGDDRLCHQEWLRHPLQYYAVKKKGNSRKASAQSS